MFLAIDPGKATGVAWLLFDSPTSEPVFKSFIHTGTRLDLEHQVYRLLTEKVAQGWDIEVVIERFEIRKNTHQLSNQEDARYIIGAVEFITDLLPGIEYHEQSAGQMKSFANTPREFAKVRALGWHHVGEGHDNDAAGHLLTYLANERTEYGEWMRDALAEALS